jgi:hypothetical protein
MTIVDDEMRGSADGDLPVTKGRFSKKVAVA